MNLSIKCRPAWMDPKQEDIREIRRGDKVVIHMGYREYPCEVISADRFAWAGEIHSWYMEVKHPNGEYGYWKQGSDGREIDGGWVEVVGVRAVECARCGKKSTSAEDRSKFPLNHELETLCPECYYF